MPKNSPQMDEPIPDEIARILSRAIRQAAQSDVPNITFEELDEIIRQEYRRCPS